MAKKSNFLFTLDLLILSILKDKDCYGYELIKIISHETKEIVNPKMGTMYPVLYELLENNYISSYEEHIKSKTRVYYHLEESGIKHLQEITKEYDELVNALNSIIHKKE